MQKASIFKLDIKVTLHIEVKIIFEQSTTFIREN